MKLHISALLFAVGCGDAPSGEPAINQLLIGIRDVADIDSSRGEACGTPPDQDPCVESPGVSGDDICLKTSAGGPLGRAWANPPFVPPGSTVWACVLIDEAMAPRVSAAEVRVTLRKPAEKSTNAPDLPYDLVQDEANESLWALELAARKDAPEADWQLGVRLYLDAPEAAAP